MHNVILGFWLIVIWQIDIWKIVMASLNNSVKLVQQDGTVNRLYESSFIPPTEWDIVVVKVT